MDFDFWPKWGNKDQIYSPIWNKQKIKVCEAKSGSQSCPDCVQGEGPTSNKWRPWVEAVEPGTVQEKEPCRESTMGDSSLRGFPLDPQLNTGCTHVRAHANQGQGKPLEKIKGNSLIFTQSQFLFSPARIENSWFMGCQAEYLGGFCLSNKQNWMNCVCSYLFRQNTQKKLFPCNNDPDKCQKYLKGF